MKAWLLSLLAVALTCTVFGLTAIPTGTWPPAPFGFLLGVLLASGAAVGLAMFVVAVEL